MRLTRYKKIILIIFVFTLLYFLGGGIAILANAYEKDMLKEAGGENWGLGFSEEGRPPVANATAEELKQYDAYYIGDTNKKVIYLTFDAGYDYEYTCHR